MPNTIVRDKSFHAHALSEKSLNQVEKLKRDQVRADMFKNILVNLI